MTTFAEPERETPEAAGPKRTSPRRWLRNRSELGFAAGVLAIAIFMTVQTLQIEVPDGAGTPGPRFFPTIVTIFLYVTGLLLAVNVIRNPRHTEPTTTRSQISTDLLEDLAGIDDTAEIQVVRTGSRRAGRGKNRTVAAPQTAAAERDVEDRDVETADDTGEPARAEDQGAAEQPPAAPVTAGSDYIPVDYRTVGIVLVGLVGFVLLLEPVGWILTAAALFWVVCYALGSKRPGFDIGVSVIVASFIQIAFSAALGLNLPAGFLEGLLPWSN